MKNQPINGNLSTAKTAKNDEFYTQYVDIQKEVEAYLEFDKDTFRGKVVYCNCDDPFESNFFKYFAANFNRLGLKKLTTTSYDGSPIAGKQLSFFEYDEGNGERQKPKAIAVEIEDVKDINGDGSTGIDDVELFLEQTPHSRTPLAEGGDFRSAECIALLKEADIVVTNPPFSLFREYVALLVKHEKKFLIIGNTNSISYKEIFPLIKVNKLWLGCTNFNVGMFFEVPDEWENFHHIDNNTGRKIARVATYTLIWESTLDLFREGFSRVLFVSGNTSDFMDEETGKLNKELVDDLVRHGYSRESVDYAHSLKEGTKLLRSICSLTTPELIETVANQIMEYVDFDLLLTNHQSEIENAIGGEVMIGDGADQPSLLWNVEGSEIEIETTEVLEESGEVVVYANAKFANEIEYYIFLDDYYCIEESLDRLGISLYEQCEDINKALVGGNIPLLVQFNFIYNPTTHKASDFEVVDIQRTDVGL